MLPLPGVDDWRISYGYGNAVLGPITSTPAVLIDPIGVLGILGYPEINGMDVTLGNNNFIAIDHFTGAVATEWMRFEQKIRLDGLILGRPFLASEFNLLRAVGDNSGGTGQISARGRIRRDTRVQGSLQLCHNDEQEFANGGTVSADNNTTYLTLYQLRPGDKVALTLMHVAPRASTSAAIVVADDVAGTNAVVLCSTTNKSFTDRCYVGAMGGTAGRFILLRNIKSGAGAQSVTGYIQGIHIRAGNSKRFHRFVEEATANNNTQWATLYEVTGGQQIRIDHLSLNRGTSTRATIGVADTAGGANFVAIADCDSAISDADVAVRTGDLWRVIQSTPPASVYVVLRNIAPVGGPHPVEASISGTVL